MTDETAAATDDGRVQVPMEVSTSGAVSARQRKAIESMVTRVIQSMDSRVAHVRIRAEHHPERAKGAPVTVRVVLDIKGGPVRTDVRTETFHEAIDAVEHRLRKRIRHRAERRQAVAQRGSARQTGAWRHGDASRERPPYYPRPVDDRRIVRHKSFSPATSTVEEAVFDLDSMGYDFFLFVEEMSGDDALVAKLGDGRFSLHFRTGAVDGAVPESAGVVVEQHGAPRLGIAAAEERLDVGHEPWVFFEDDESGRGHVLYRRYDGHYGLIVPRDEPD